MQPKSAILEPGNYEFAFKHELPGNMPESVEGLREGSITYKLKATVSNGIDVPKMIAFCGTVIEYSTLLGQMFSTLIACRNSRAAGSSVLMSRICL